MNLQDLPLELFDQSFAELLELIGLYKIQRLRSTSHTFNGAILRAIDTSFLHDPSWPIHQWIGSCLKTRSKLKAIWMGRFIFAKMTAHSSNDILGPLRDAIQAFDEKVPDTAQHVYKRTIRICEATADYFYWDKEHNLELTYIQLASAITPDYANPEPCDTTKQHVFCAAIVTGNMSIVEELIFLPKVRVNHESPYFGRPLHLAIRWGYVEIVKLLISCGAKTEEVQWRRGRAKNDIADNTGSPLKLACAHGHFDIVRLLIGPSHRRPLTAGMYSQFAMGGHGYVRILQFIQDEGLIDTAKLTLHEKQDIRDHILYDACKSGQIEVVELMIRSGADPQWDFFDIYNDFDSTIYTHYVTAVHLAAKYGHTDVLRLLLRSGYKPHKNGYGFRELLELAIAAERFDTIRLLLPLSTVDIRSSEDGLWLLACTMPSQVLVFKFLLELGADLSTVCLGRDGRTVGEGLLHKAIATRSSPFARMLVELGVSPDKLRERFGSRVDEVLSNYS